MANGHTDYYGANDYKTTSPAKYEFLKVAETSNEEWFKTDLKAHQDGQSGSKLATFVPDHKIRAKSALTGGFFIFKLRIR